MGIKLLISLFFAFIVLGCDTNSKSKKFEIIRKHYNIKIAVDLSNRITNPSYKCSISDIDIVNSILNLIYPTITNYQRKINQYDKYELDFINKKHINDYSVNTQNCVIDLAKFKNNQLLRNEYLGVFKSTSQFKTEKLNFLNEFTKLIQAVNANNDHGSDLFTYLQNLTEQDIITKELVVEDENEKLINKTENIIIILTDGYIETSNINDNNKMSKDLSFDKINSFRNDFIANGHGENIDVFFKNNKYGIIPTKNALLANTKILVMQLFDRNATSGKNKYEPSDMEIIKLFWTDWLLRSGVKQENFKLIQNTETTSPIKAEQIICSFLGII
ncbi:hypothetical protein [Runella salmonicolor]|uniref:Lipoprotein n=1 Tax=Runella salmonicolor TaxID=2950278 RepID=A0ABT1FQL9_9BACT|nr:hypothetical protein [Runella salmonicolor]MCP1384064.1 hypothetical protein [Runella salmonicolor]